MMHIHALCARSAEVRWIAASDPAAVPIRVTGLRASRSSVSGHLAIDTGLPAWLVLRSVALRATNPIGGACESGSQDTGRERDVRGPDRRSCGGACGTPAVLVGRPRADQQPTKSRPTADQQPTRSHAAPRRARAAPRRATPRPSSNVGMTQWTPTRFSKVIAESRPTAEACYSTPPPFP